MTRQLMIFYATKYYEDPSLCNHNKLALRMNHRNILRPINARNNISWLQDLIVIVN